MKNRLNSMQYGRLVAWIENEGRALIEQHGARAAQVAEAATQGLGFQVSASSVGTCAAQLGIKKLAPPAPVAPEGLDARLERVERLARTTAEAVLELYRERFHKEPQDLFAVQSRMEELEQTLKPG